jgi:hypothetical protein
VRGLTGGEFWIGLAQPVGTSACGKPSFAWVTGEPPGEDLWNSGEPNCNLGHPQGARMAGNGWSDHIQTNGHAFICEAGPRQE